MTRMYVFRLPDGKKLTMGLAWRYVPYYEELQEWINENWDVEIDFETNYSRFKKAMEEIYGSGQKPEHPISWVKRIVQEHLDSPD